MMVASGGPSFAGRAPNASATTPCPTLAVNASRVIVEEHYTVRSRLVARGMLRALSLHTFGDAEWQLVSGPA